MTPQIFRGTTLIEARRAAVRALGEGAVLHTTRVVARAGVMGWFGMRDFEVSATPAEDELPALPPATEHTPHSTAPASQPRRVFSSAVYRDPEPAQAAAPAETETSDVMALRAALRAELRVDQALASRDQGLTPAIEAELSALRAAIDAMNEGDSAAGAAGRLLRAAGIEGKAATLVSAALRSNDTPGATLHERFRDALVDVVRVGPWPLATDGPAVIALVGPSGVGKTTTAAKLAARAIIDDRRSVTFISCDGYRVGAVDQLRRYASLLDARFEVAPTPRELARAVAAAGTDLVIVDTAGRAPGRGGSIPAALGFARTNVGRTKIFEGRSRHVLLCLPASLRARDVDAFCRAFSPSAPNGLVITKLDETRSPAALVHGPAASGLPVTTLCFGQRVPEDIAPATSGAVLDHVAPARRSTSSRRNTGT